MQPRAGVPGCCSRRGWRRSGRTRRAGRCRRGRRCWGTHYYGVLGIVPKKVVVVLVPVTLGVVGHHVQTPRVEHAAQSLNLLFAARPGNRRLDNRLRGLVGEEGCC